MEKLTPIQKSPFCCYVAKTIPLAFDESLSYYECCAALKAYLQNIIIPAINEDKEAINGIQTLVAELQEYVDNYFENLDVQDEIDHKLDEMVEDGTLEQIIGDYLSVDCEYIFPGKWGLSGSGSSGLIKIQDKAILMDTNSSTVYSYLTSMLDDENVTHLDYVIISHFDSDHRGNFLSLISDGYIDENTIYIHPTCPVSIYGSDVVAVYNHIEDVCTANGITSIVPTENQVISVTDDFSMRFGNVDQTYVLAHYTTPNQASMVVECTHNNFHSLFMADAVRQSQQYLFDSGFIQNGIDLYTIPHHAIEHECYLPFYDQIKPKFAVGETQMQAFNQGILSYNQDGAILNENGCSNYYSFNNVYNIKFVERGGSLHCAKGVPTLHTGYASNSYTIYCDSVNYNENLQNGTEQYPYKDLIQALGVAPDFDNKQVIIKLKNGTYGTTYTGEVGPSNNVCCIYNRKNYIVVSGTSKDGTILNYGMDIVNCANCRVDTMTIKTRTSGNACNVSSSNVMFRDVIFLGEDGDSLSGYGINANTHSKVDTINCKFQYLASAYTVTALSELNTVNDTLLNLTYAYRHENGVTINPGFYNSATDWSTITNLENYSASRYIHSNPYPLTQTIADPNMLDAIPLLVKRSNIYRNITIKYEQHAGASMNGRNQFTIKNDTTTTAVHSDFNTKTDGDTLFNTLVYTLGSNNLSITRNSVTKISNAGVVTTYEPASNTDTDNGIRITDIIFE